MPEPMARPSPDSPDPAAPGNTRDVFPNTASTWLTERIAGHHADPAAARRHVMTVYFEPLTIYVQGTPFRHLAEPRELVSGFFADRLDRDDFLPRWLSSGRPLRRWLIGGLRFYLLEQARVQKSGRARPIPDDHADPDPDRPGSAFNRAAGHRIIRDAMERTAAQMADLGLSEHWDVFVMRHIDEIDYKAIRQRTGLDERRAAVMVRTAMRRFGKTLRDLVAWPGATIAEVDRELATFFGDPS
jgi:DNA-directed RNA polymerase specialized sigma24 family protein